MPVNVMHLVQGLDVGGLEMMVVSLAKRLDRERYRPAICCFDCVGPLADEVALQGVDVFLVKRRSGVDVSYIFKLARFLRRQNTQVLHLHNPTAFFYGALAGRLARISRIIYTEHGRDFSRSRKVQLADRMLSQLVNAVVSVAEWGRRYLVTQEGIDPRRIITIYNGVDAGKLAPRRDRAQMRRELGLRDDDAVVGIVARLDPIKNHRCLLHAVAGLVAEIPELRLLIVGEGPMRTELEVLTGALGLQSQVRFLGCRNDIGDLLNAMDIFVLASLSEGLSLTLIEACIAGRPIVATDVGGNAEVVAHGVNGLLVPPDDPGALAAAIRALTQDWATAAHMGTMGRRRFEERFTLDRMVRRYEALYGNSERISALNPAFTS